MGKVDRAMQIARLGPTLPAGNALAGTSASSTAHCHACLAILSDDGVDAHADRAFTDMDNARAVSPAQCGVCANLQSCETIAAVLIMGSVHAKIASEPQLGVGKNLHTSAMRALVSTVARDGARWEGEALLASNANRRMRTSIYDNAQRVGCQMKPCALKGLSISLPPSTCTPEPSCFQGFIIVKDASDVECANCPNHFEHGFGVSACAVDQKFGVGRLGNWGVTGWMIWDRVRMTASVIRRSVGSAERSRPSDSASARQACDAQIRSRKAMP